MQGVERSRLVKNYKVMTWFWGVWGWAGAAFPYSYLWLSPWGCEVLLLLGMGAQGMDHCPKGHPPPRSFIQTPAASPNPPAAAPVSPLAAGGPVEFHVPEYQTIFFFFLTPFLVPKRTQCVFWSAFPCFDHPFCRSVFLFRGTAGHIMNANTMRSEINV